MMTRTVDPPDFPSVLYRAKGLMGLAKPAGMHVFGEKSLAAWLVQQHPCLASVGPKECPAIVHRLDQGTSGIMLAAENQDKYDYLRGLFSSGQVKKWYLAIVEGEMEKPLTVDKPLGGRYRRSARVWVDDGSRKLRGVRQAVTHIEPISTTESFSLCRIKIPTGTRHQIRAHLSYMGHPVFGDRLYGAVNSIKKPGDRFFLHAFALEFMDPESKEPVLWRCPLDKGFMDLLDSGNLYGDFRFDLQKLLT